MLTYTLELEPQTQKGDGYRVTVPALPGCVSEGNTLEEVLKNIKDAIEGYLKVLAKHWPAIPLEFSEFYKAEVFKKKRPEKIKNLVHA